MQKDTVESRPLGGDTRYSTTNLNKYQSSNRVVQFLLQRFLGQLGAMAAVCAPHAILDVGCGEGFVVRTLVETGAVSSGTSYIGVDQSCEALRFAGSLDRNNGFSCMRAGELAFSDGVFDLVMCVEVLEHVPDARAVLAELGRVSSRYCIVSVPHEPFFRIGNLLRGQYLSGGLASWGDHPEHVNHWGPRTLRALLSEFFSVERLTYSFPWLIALCRK